MRKSAYVPCEQLLCDQHVHLCNMIKVSRLYASYMYAKIIFSRLLSTCFADRFEPYTLGLSV